MKIEAGKRYVRRDGAISGVIDIYDDWEKDPKSAFIDNEPPIGGDRIYDPDGGNIYGDDASDLISEYIEPAADTSDYQRGINDAVKWFNARNPHLLISITAKLIEKELK